MPQDHRSSSTNRESVDEDGFAPHMESTSPLVVPPPLRAGDRIAVLAPSSAPRSADRYTEGLRRLHHRYEVVERYGPEEVEQPHGYLSAPDHRRLEDLETVLRRSDLRAVVVARGGYGTLRLLDRLSLENYVSKWVVGYSDTTALQMMLYRSLGWASLSGPVVTEWAQIPLVSDPGDASEDDDPGPRSMNAADAFDRVATASDGTEVDLRMSASLECLSTVASEGHTTTGPLLGGNLSVLTRLVGTPFMPDLTGSVLVLEDVAEAPYRVDRMLTHLRLAGHLHDLAAVVLGSFTPGDVDPPSWSMEEVLVDAFRDVPYPVVSGLVYGHCLPRITIPWGIPATLDTSGHASGEIHLTAHIPPRPRPPES